MQVVCCETVGLDGPLYIAKVGFLQRAFVVGEQCAAPGD